MSHLVVFLLLLVSCVTYALWRGGPPERAAALTFIAGVVASEFVGRPSLRWAGVQVGLLAVDAAMLAVFLVLLVRANRLWPIPMAALQMIQVAGHFLKGLDPHLYPFLYWLTSSIWSYFMIVLLIAATALHRRRLRRFGHDEPWSRSSPLGSARTPAPPPPA